MQQSTSPNQSNGMAMGMGIGIDSEDLLYEIFLRLPLISLVRFKYVSKSWYSLISNFDFLSRHWNYNNNNNIENDTKRRIDLLLLGTSSDRVDVIDSALSIFRLNLSLPKSANKDEQCLVLNNSCNGLLLYHQSLMLGYNVSSNDDRTVFYVCNPITKHYIKIPNIELKNVVEQDEYKKLMIDTTTACIVFDPSVSLSYKVIRCCFKGTRRNCRMGRSYYCYDYVLYVYSSETGSWKVLTSLSGDFGFGFRAALVNGVFYWYTNIGDDCLCFDVEKEDVWFLPLPTKPMKHRHCLYFGECGGRLRLIPKYTNTTDWMNGISFPCSFDIMELEQQQENERQYIWRVKYHVQMDPKFDHLKQRDESVKGFIMHLYRSTTGKRNGEDEEEEALLMNIIGTDMVVSFNLTSNTFEDELIVIPNTKHAYELQGVVPYIPTLFPVHL